ncbi:MAG: leucine--tRNA ligase [Gemmatimonadetes bacterium]|nr:leucine--tRNA ligase [Gemmatimonadota bacterium]MBK7786433.1 leucine--tRNA ligase [Gemmatimonadota bacterium]
MNDGYRPDEVEAKWRARWAERGTNQPDLDHPKRPFYNLMMFPYPSAEGLHVGNMFAFTGSDVYGRYQRLRGYDVFEPIGYDAFGIHSENYAIKVGLHPAELIPRNIANFRRQLERIGGMFDWRHALSTTDPAYYKWTQWIFLQLFKAGKAYKKKAAVNWCPNCKTVLANEQVENGLCERCKTPVEQRFLEQWFFRITEYAERLLRNLDTLDWSDTTRTAQRNWLGRSEGAEITFTVPAEPSGRRGAEAITVFTTRPDTLFGATFMVLAPEHPAVARLTTPDRRAEVEAYVQRAAAMDLVARKVGDKDKTGVFLGAYATNPATGRPVPVWIADYVLMEYGTGAIMAVPAHDERDFAFATQFGLEIVRVLAGEGQAAGAPLAAAETEVAGFRLVNSGRFDGQEAEAAKQAITAWLAAQGLGKAVVQYRLHDWCISRQRYWGPPIPVIYCDACGPVAVPEPDLPVILPPIEDFRPDDSGVSPLARHEEWYFVPCPACGARARRETDVSDTFLDSAWYYLRYPSTEFADRPFDPARTRAWCPVTTYIGGNEHAVLHLLYSRFLAMVLKDLGHIGFEEPFTRFRAHGLIVKDGSKMSKSRGNVVIPDEYIAQWGADTFRMYLMFLGPLQEGGDFRDAGINGPRRFLERVWVMVAEVEESGGELRKDLVTRWHATRKKCAEDIEGLRYNTAIAALMELVNHMKDAGCRDTAMVRDLVVMLAPFAPHFSEECWERLGGTGSVFDAGWPMWDEALTVADEIELPVQVSGKTRSKVSVARNATEADAKAAALADPTVRRFTDGKEITKVIYVPNRLLNIVVAG